MIYDLNESNFDIIITKAYSGKYWTKEELELDLKRIRYIKRLIGKYIRKHELNDRLILNHIIILGNVFGPELTTKILFLRLDKEYHSVLKTFLLYLEYLPNEIYYVNGNVIDTKIIPVEMNVANKLREI